jgi:hypothetical protein
MTEAQKQAEDAFAAMLDATQNESKSTTENGNSVL